MTHAAITACVEAEMRMFAFLSFTGVMFLILSVLAINELANLRDELERENERLRAECESLHQRLGYYEAITDITARTRSAIRGHVR